MIVCPFPLREIPALPLTMQHIVLKFSVKAYTALHHFMYKSSQLQECGLTGTLTRCWWEGNMVQTFWKIVWQFLKGQ